MTQSATLGRGTPQEPMPLRGIPTSFEASWIFLRSLGLAVGCPDPDFPTHRLHIGREERHVPRRLNSAAEANLAAPCPGCSFLAEGHDARWPAGPALELSGFLAFDHWHS